MNLLAAFALIFGVLTMSIGAQNSTGEKPKENQSSQTTPDEKWKVKTFENRSVKSLIIPENFLEQDEVIDIDLTGLIATKYFSQTWTKPPAAEINLNVTDWDADFAKVTGQTPDMATPELLLAIDLMADMTRMRKPNSNTEKVAYYEVDGIRGGLVYLTIGKKSELTIVWATYRYYKGKAQRIMISMDVPRKDLDVAMKILDSLKFEKKADE